MEFHVLSQIEFAICCVANKLLLCCQEDVRSSRFDVNFIRLIDRLLLQLESNGSNEANEPKLLMSKEEQEKKQQSTTHGELRRTRAQSQSVWSECWAKNRKRIIVTTRK